MHRESQVFIPLTGRCFLSKHFSKGNASGASRQYTLINRSIDTTIQTQSASRSPLINSPLQQLACSERFGMNDYYRERFEHSQMFSSSRGCGGSSSSSGSDKQHTHSVPFYVGDIIIHLIPRLMNNAYHENKTHNRLLSSAQLLKNSTANMHNSHQSFSDRLIREMHMLDGSEVAELNQGLVSVGKVVVFAVCKNNHHNNNAKLHFKHNARIRLNEETHSNAVIAPHHVESHLSIIENAAPLLCERRILSYRSEYEAMQLVDMVRHHFDQLYKHNLLRLKVSHDDVSGNYNSDAATLRFVLVQRHAANSAS